MQWAATRRDRAATRRDLAAVRLDRGQLFPETAQLFLGTLAAVLHARKAIPRDRRVLIIFSVPLCPETGTQVSRTLPTDRDATARCQNQEQDKYHCAPYI